MITAVVPAQNEGGRIATVLRNLQSLPFDHIIVVANGSRDSTLREVLSLGLNQLQLLYFHERLGIDIPRAVGAQAALSLGSTAVVFVDGDMIGCFGDNIVQLIEEITLHQTDLALTDCYSSPPRHIERCNPTFRWRLQLNRELGLDKKIALATPSHGPHAVSRRFLETISLADIAVPPVTLALARRHRLKIEVGTAIPHHQLGSARKTDLHCGRIIDTIVGDCLEAICAYKGLPRSREWQNKIYLGYHPQRRFDVLKLLQDN